MNNSRSLNHSCWRNGITPVLCRGEYFDTDSERYFVQEWVDRKYQLVSWQVVKEYMRLKRMKTAQLRLHRRTITEWKREEFDKVSMNAVVTLADDLDISPWMLISMGDRIMMSEVSETDMVTKEWRTNTCTE